MPNSNLPDDVRQLLRTAGMWVTASRMAVLEVLGDHPHATADTVARLVTQRLGLAARMVDEAGVVFWGLRPVCRDQN